MALEETEIELLRESLVYLQERKVLAASVFYENLFEIDGVGARSRPNVVFPSRRCQFTLTVFGFTARIMRLRAAI